MAEAAPDRGDTLVAFAGDWHEDTTWAVRTLTELGRRGVRTVYHLGDFGVFPRGGRSSYLETVEQLCQQHDIQVWVTPGNHENWDHLTRLHSGHDAGRPRPLLPHTPHLHAIPRGYRWSHAGRTFVSLGGAPSVDLMDRAVGKTWWFEEMIPEETAHTVAADGHAEVMLAHDIPNLPVPEVRRIIDVNHFGWDEKVLAYAARGRQLLDVAIAGVQPTVYAHGHYHVMADTAVPDGPRVLSLSMNGRGGNVCLIDLDAADFSPTWV